MVSFGYKAFYVENLSLAEQNPACSVGQPWPGEQVVLCTLSLCTTGSPVWPWWQNSGALLTSTDGPVLEARTEDASCPPLPLFLPSVAFPFPKGFFPFFLLYNPTAMPSPAAFPSCIRRLTHCSAQLGCTSLPWDMGPHGCRQGLGLAHSEACTQLRAEASARVPPSLPLPRSFKLRCDGSAFLLPPWMAAAVTPQAFGHGLFNIFFQLSHLQSPELLPALLPWVRQLLTATTSSALQPDAFQLCALQGEAKERVPSLHLHHITGIQNGTESYFSSLDVGKLGWSASAKAHLSSAACNSCLSKSIIWGLSQSLLSRSQFF